MTQNATLLHAEQAIRAGLLIAWHGEPGAIATERCLYMTPDVADMFSGKQLTERLARLDANAIAERFVRGHLLRVSDRRRSAGADLKRLVGHAEMWWLGTHRPRPGFRFLGRFLARDHFVLLAGRDRERLGRDGYADAIRECDLRAERIFPGVPVFSGTQISDYLSRGVIHV